MIAQGMDPQVRELFGFMAEWIAEARDERHAEEHAAQAEARGDAEEAAALEAARRTEEEEAAAKLV